MPPEYYAQKARESEVKMIAQVTAVVPRKVMASRTLKEVSFEPHYILEGAQKERFTGTCYGLETASQKRRVSGNGSIYYYPRKGDTVFVTITRDGGEITGLKKLTPELERIIRDAPYRIPY